MRLFPGERRVWVAAGVVLAVLAIYAAAVVLRSRDALTGTNSVAGLAAVEQAAAGERVCTHVRVPPDTTIVQVYVGLPEAERSTLRASLRPARGPAQPLEAIEVVPGLDYKSLPIDPASQVREGDLCLESSDSRIDLGGAATGHNPNEPPLRIGERERADIELSVRFLRTQDKPSLLSLLPDAPGRAQWFRPGPIGPFVYWLIALVVLPVLAYSGLRVLATAGERRARRTALAVAAIAFVGSASWALTTPPYQAPDESEHFAYAQHLAETGEKPEVSPGTRPAYSLEEGYLLQGLRHSSSVFLGAARPRWLEADERAWKQVDAQDLPRDNGGGYTTAASAHSPLYYGALAPAYLAASGGDLTWRLTLMRLLNALLASVIAACAALVVRELLPGHPLLAAAAGLLVAFEPVVSFMSGAVNNDTAVNAAAAVALYLVVRALRRGLTLRLAVGIGLALVALPLAKITGYGVVPAVAIGLLIAVARLPRPAALRTAAAAAGSIAVAALAWTQVLVPALAGGGGTLVTSGAARPSEIAAVRDPLVFVDYLVQTFVPPIHLTGKNLSYRWPFYDIYVEGGFGRFGWGTIGFPELVYQTIVVVAIGLGALAIAALWRRRSAVRAQWAPAVVLGLAGLGVVAFVAAAYATDVPRPTVAEQGRYAFPALVPVAALAALACLGLGRRWVPVLAGGLVGAMIALGIGGWLQAFSAWYT